MLIERPSNITGQVLLLAAAASTDTCETTISGLLHFPIFLLAKQFRRLLQYLDCRGMFSSYRNIAQSCCSKSHHGDTSTLHAWRTNEGTTRAVAPVFELKSLISANSSEEMSKKHSFNTQLSSVLIWHTHALLAGHAFTPCQNSVPIFLAWVQSGALRWQR